MTKSELIEKCRKILYSNPINYPLSSDDFNFLMSLFPLHPEWKMKRSGKNIKSVIIRKHETYHNLCFALVFEDGSKVDISFTECINRSLKKYINTACATAINDLPVKDNFNSIVKEWVKSFENQDLTVGLYLGGLDEGGEPYFKDQTILDSFRQYYEQI